MSQPSSTNRPNDFLVKFLTGFSCHACRTNRASGSCYRRLIVFTVLGGNSDRVPPLPIPNREVKPVSADGTAIMWESRSPPSSRGSSLR